MGKFNNATTGMTFTLPFGGGYTTYRAGNWSVIARFFDNAGTYTAEFNFDDFNDNDGTTQTTTARETVSGAVTVTVNDMCNGAASINAVQYGGIDSTTEFKILVPHTLAGAVQWTQMVSDTVGAASPYTEDAADNAGNAEWTFDFVSATATDVDVEYKLTVAGTNNMHCIAVAMFDVTAIGSSPITIP